jgi:hypothetical protein
MIRINVRHHGPVFDGRAQAEVIAFAHAAAREVALEGEDDVHRQLPRVLRHPTGYYQSRIRADQIGVSTWRVHDSRVIYGPWLEGVGSRNRTTRFKGYATFRIIRQRLQAKAPEIAERVLPPYLRRMQ